MKRIAASLTLALLALPAGAQPISAIELLPLPPVKGKVSISAEPFERTVTVESPDGSAAIARGLAALSRGLCPDVKALPRSVVITCRSTRVVPRLVPRGALLALELRELDGLPASGDTAMPILFHDPLSLGLGGCPGANHAARGECRLREGRRDLAHGSFLTASRSAVAAERDHALLRLGDLDLAAGDVESAQRRWATIELQPWRRMADARRCELSVECLESKGEAPFAREGLPNPFARELALRAARARAFRGETLPAAWALADQFSSAGACVGEATLCRRIVLSALRSRDEDSAREALAIYVAAVRPGKGAFAAELASAAAGIAARSDAPGFAAALLSSASAHVPEAALVEHLLRTAELYVAAGDAVRARVVLDFLRTRRGAAAPRGPRWTALLRDVATLRAGAARAEPVARPDAPELAAAARLLERSRATSSVTRGDP